MRRCLVTLLFGLLSLKNFAFAEPDEFVLLRSRPGGMFSIFMDVVALAESYEAGHVGGFRVAFGTTGLYYEEGKGYNWWNYYCKPIHYGKMQGKKILEIKRIHPLSNPFRIENQRSREEVHRLIQKYIKIKPGIRAAIDNFERTEFHGHYMIGVHYRGTDKIIEAPRVAYTTVEKWVKDQLRQHVGQKCKIFVATDEQPFLDFMKSKFSWRVCCLPNADRSSTTDRVHGKKNQSPYRQGKHALMDCILLSRTNFLIRTSSNLSLFATYFNPKIPVVNLSSRW